jgi:hypothetical protein
MKRRMLLPLAAVTVALLCSASAASADNSAAAHECEQGGYNALVGAQGQTFSNAGQCVSFAANGGQFASGIVIPKGHTATFTNSYFSACNALTWGYQLNFGANQDQGTFPGGCIPAGSPDVTIGPFPTAELVRVYLTDNSCGFGPYYSDGDHAQVTGANPYQVAITDGDSDCSSPPGNDRPPVDGVGNFNTTLTVN